MPDEHASSGSVPASAPGSVGSLGTGPGMAPQALMSGLLPVQTSGNVLLGSDAGKVAAKLHDTLGVTSFVNLVKPRETS